MSTHADISCLPRRNELLCFSGRASYTLGCECRHLAHIRRWSDHPLPMRGSRLYKRTRFKLAFGMTSMEDIGYGATKRLVAIWRLGGSEIRILEQLALASAGFVARFVLRLWRSLREATIRSSLREHGC